MKERTIEIQNADTRKGLRDNQTRSQYIYEVT